MVEVFRDVLDSQALNGLVTYFKIKDTDLDARPDVISKSPDPNSDTWPAHHVRHALDQILDRDYHIEEALFHESWTRYHLHADTARGQDQQPLYKAVLFPLTFAGTAGTVFFKNHWSGPSAKFTKATYNKWQYRLPNRHGSETVVPDLREIRDRARSGDTALAEEFVLDHDFLDMLDHLIRVRDDSNQSNAFRPILRHEWINDYSQVQGANDIAFPEHLRESYCRHVSAEDLHGLTFDQYVPWQMGSAIVFDRTQIHCTGNGDLGKLGLTVFTNLA
jgi:hypothetical protein